MKILSLVILLLVIFACETSTSKEIEQSRSFVMGFTPWPYDFTKTAQLDVYQKVLSSSDFISHHFDEGVPWNEALKDTIYPRAIREDIEFRLSQTPEGKKVYLSLTPLSSRDRSSIALYYGSETNMELPESWKNKTFDHPDVIKAYINYCKYMVERFSPAFFNYGIEVSGSWTSDTEPKFKRMLTLLNSTYTELKKAYPNLPIFVSIAAHPERPENTTPEVHRRINLECLKYSDYNAFSLYPYATVNENPNNLPRDYFQQLKDLSPDKPFIIAETGFTAKTLSFYNGTLVINGSEKWQYDYLDFALKEANRLDCKLFMWFLIQDYELAWEKLESAGFDETFKLWKNIGFIDENNKARESMFLWNEWLKKNIDMK